MSYLKQIKACIPAQEWADAQPSYREAWEACDRPDWMMWFVRKQNVDENKIIAANVEIARTVQHLMTDSRSLQALDVAERYTRDEATEKELEEARDAAYAANGVVGYVSAAYAAYAAAYTDYDADTADAAVDAAASAAAYAAAAADAPVAADAYAFARKQSLKNSAEIIRKHIKFEELGIKEEWPDETRIDIIGQNGNDGDHYDKRAKK